MAGTSGDLEKWGFGGQGVPKVWPGGPCLLPDILGKGKLLEQASFQAAANRLWVLKPIFEGSIRGRSTYPAHDSLRTDCGLCHWTPGF